MICSQCARRLGLSSIPRGSPIRLLSSTVVIRSQNLPHSTQDPPPATSTSAAQPFSTPFTSSPAHSSGFPPDSPAISSPPAPKSSVKAGTLLKGLGYIKGKDGPVAKEDHEYPEWLWGLLDKTEKVSGVKVAEEGADEYAKSKKQRRIAAKAARKAAIDNPSSLLPIVPLEQQSIDLPAGNNGEAEQARDALRVAMRNARRKGIKEANFLKTVR